MIALDTNLLVYAHRPEMPHHRRALSCLEGLANGPQPWCIPWPCVHEFIAIVTNPRIFRDPTKLPVAVQTIEELGQSASLQFLAEAEGYLAVLSQQARAAEARGALIHDARIAALCIFHGVQTLWTADRDFGRFPRLAVHNPLVE